MRAKLNIAILRAERAKKKIIEIFLMCSARMQYHNIGLCAHSAPKILTFCIFINQYFNVKFNGFVVPYSGILTFSCITYYQFFKLSKLLEGGGGVLFGEFGTLRIKEDINFTMTMENLL